MVEKRLQIEVVLKFPVDRLRNSLGDVRVFSPNMKVAEHENCFCPYKGLLELQRFEELQIAQERTPNNLSFIGIEIPLVPRVSRPGTHFPLRKHARVFGTTVRNRSWFGISPMGFTDRRESNIQLRTASPGEQNGSRPLLTVGSGGK